eukprot:TRINITY_DN60479_c0_g1_i1.p1 TRINITY_DN60479_c0_g1~~TRINITY_DN60479_c0_g1_i1.p1  ORF type:complete len:920 (-),score=94.64 TRINITY_DN60479_c0_g1_i1:75-2810(-)
MYSTVPRSCVFAWSASVTNQKCVATASPAVLDESFSVDSTLELFDLLSGTHVCSPVTAKEKFNALSWQRPHEADHGLIAGAMIDGSIEIWDDRSLLEQQEPRQPFVLAPAHKGAVSGVDLHPLGKAMAASSGQDGWWYVWNLARPGLYETLPSGAVAHQTEVSQVKWNSKVEHIVGLGSQDGTLVVWDLRTKRAALSLQTGLPSCTSLSWSSATPTDVCVSSSQGNGAIQFWDLKKASRPQSLLQQGGHQGGVLGLSWSPFDSRFLLSCGVDGRTLCWNPKTSALLADIPVPGTQQQQQANWYSSNANYPANNANCWVMDVQWAPKDPTLFATVCSSGGALNVHNFSSITMKDKAPIPNWVTPPSSASFGFGGQLVRHRFHTQQGVAEQTQPNNINIGRVPCGGTPELHCISTEPELAARSEQLKALLQNFSTQKQNGNLATANSRNAATLLRDHCYEQAEKNTGKRTAFQQQRQKGEDGPLTESEVWEILGCLMEHDPKKHLLTWLGFTQLDTSATVSTEDEEHVSRLVEGAIVVRDFASAVQLCIQAQRLDDALLIASFDPSSSCCGKLWDSTLTSVLKAKEGSAFVDILDAVVNPDPSGSLQLSSSRQYSSRTILGLLCGHSSPDAFRVALQSCSESSTSVSPFVTQFCQLCSGQYKFPVGSQTSNMATAQELIHKMVLYNTVCTHSKLSINTLSHQLTTNRPRGDKPPTSTERDHEQSALYNMVKNYTFALVEEGLAHTAHLVLDSLSVADSVPVHLLQSLFERLEPSQPERTADSHTINTGAEVKKVPVTGKKWQEIDVGFGGLGSVCVKAEHQPIVGGLVQLWEKTSKVQKPAVPQPKIEKGLVTLFSQMDKQELDPEVGNLLLKFTNAAVAGQHGEVREAVLGLTNGHWDQFSQFRDIKHLAAV